MITSHAKIYEAFFARKVNDSYTGDLWLVRRDDGDPGTDPTQAIGFQGDGKPDVSAIETFLGESDGYIVTWYGQNEEGDLTQATAAEQPQVVWDEDEDQYVARLTGPVNIGNGAFPVFDDYTVFMRAKFDNPQSNNIAYVLFSGTVNRLPITVEDDTNLRIRGINSGGALIANANPENWATYSIQVREEVVDGCFFRKNGAALGSPFLVDTAVGSGLVLGRSNSSGSADQTTMGFFISYESEAGSMMSAQEIEDFEADLATLLEGVAPRSITITKDDVALEDVHVQWAEADDDEYTNESLLGAATVTDANGVSTYDGVFDENKVLYAKIKYREWDEGISNWRYATRIVMASENVDLTAPA